MIVHVLICLFFLLFSITADARLITEKRDGALYVKSADMQETQQLFEQYKFDKFTKLNAKYPRIYFLKLPENWDTIPESDEKHLVFLKIMLPLVLHENEKVLAERKNIENMLQKIRNGADLSAPEQNVLDNLAQKYDAFTRLKGKEKNIVLLHQLLDKVDAIPPSVLLATAGIYSNWGTSRLALHANSLYLQEVWYGGQGLKPLDDPDADYRYKVYSTLSEGIADHLLKLNSSVNYEYLRKSRTTARKIERPLYGPQIAATMLLDNNLKNIAGMIDYTFSYYQLQNTDYKAQLEDIQ